MKRDQLCVDTICWSSFPVERALEGIASTGISRVELCASLGSCDHAAPESLGRDASEKLLGLLEKHGLTAVAYSGHTDLTTQEGMVAGLDRLQLAADMGIPLFITPMPPFFVDSPIKRQLTLPSTADPNAEEFAIENAVQLADLADKLGVEMCIEFGLWGFGRVTGQDYLALLERMNRPTVRINFDAAAMTLFNEDALPTKDDISVLAPNLSHVHLCDRSSTELGKWDFCPIGEGAIDWGPLLTEFDRVGFTGHVSVELGWEGAPESPEIVDDAVRRSIAFVDKYFVF